MPGFALGIRYLTGYAVATDPATREAAEWPPHPGRVFMALAAAHLETGGDPAERAALEWLEALPAPALQVSDADRRTVVRHFVPVNADKVGDLPRSTTPVQAASELTRHRVGRTFPRVRPHDEVVYIVWLGINPDGAFRDALQRLCSKVTRVGHSSSLVQMWYTDELDTCRPTLEPTGRSPHTNMRIVSAGTLRHLERQYNAEAVEAFARLSELITGTKGEAQRQARAEFKLLFGADWRRSLQPPISRRPVLGIWQGYRWIDPERAQPATTVFDPSLLVLRLEPKISRFKSIDLVAILHVTDVLRRAVQQVATEQMKLDHLPEVLTGHRPCGEPAERPHVAYMPLGFVSAPHANGHLLGLAIALPRGEHWPDRSRERRIVMTVFAHVSELRLGALGVWQIVPETRETPPYTLLADVWTAFPEGASLWASVTPLVFDQHPKERDRAAYLEAVAEMAREACARIGLPAPLDVRVTAVSPHLGTPAAREYPRLRRKEGGDRRHTHVILRFAEPVVGPVLLGAGRYRGYGLCRPVRHALEGSA